MTAAELDAICRQLTGSAKGGGAAVWNGAADAITTLKQQNKEIAAHNEKLRSELAELRRELAEAKADGERMDWYFTQRRYSVSIGSMGVLLHDDKPNERYATLIRYSEDSAAFPSVRAVMDFARKGE